MGQVGPGYDDDFSALAEDHPAQPFEEFLVDQIFAVSLQSLEHFDQIDGVVDEEGRAEAVDEVGQDDRMRVLRQN